MYDLWNSFETSGVKIRPDVKQRLSIDAIAPTRALRHLDPFFCFEWVLKTLPYFMFSFDPKLRVAEKHANEKAFG